MRKAGCIALVCLLAGCAGSVKNSWTNFTAYYNTYYNAKQDFREGLAKVEAQPVRINPDEPVRPHPKAVLAGQEGFENAVDNAAQILRRFPDSKWTDDALLLMGKSYYYLQEYFLARQKFDELLALPGQPPSKQKAVIWKARTLLEIGSFSEGVQFIESSIATDYGWSDSDKAEANVLLAEHLTNLENWSAAAEVLEPAIYDLRNGPLAGRSYFLLGQLFERTGQPGSAFQSYSNVRRGFPDYEYTYWAEIKRAEVARKQGNMDLAVSIYSKMLNDDKNFERRDRIYYQLAQTYEKQGYFSRAERIYRQILYGTGAPSEQLQSTTYYQLGQLYIRYYNNYELAAAYFDSSSFRSSSGEREEAGRLASAYNRYLTLKQQANRADSLLYLGTLDKDTLMVRIAEVRQQRRELLKESQNQIQQTNNVITNVSGEDIYNERTEAGSADGFGFLNYRNAALAERGRSQFRSVWGERPLADNWRRQEALATVNTGQQTMRDSVSGAVPADTRSDAQLGIDLSEVPGTESERNELRDELLNAKYRLGSLFFLTLNQPDSAAYYYRSILRDSSSAQLRAQTLYSLYELHSLQQQPDSTEKYRMQILSQYPESPYAGRISSGNSTYEAGTAARDTTELLKRRLQELFNQKNTDAPDPGYAEGLYRLSTENELWSRAPYVFVESISEYIQWAKAGSDSSAVAVPDSAGAGMYAGSRWDKVRNLTDEFLQRFPEAPQAQKVKIWKQMLSAENAGQLPTCGELQVNPQPVNGMEQFLQAVSLPESVAGMNLSGTLQYRLTISAQGKVVSVERLSNPTGLGIEDAYEDAIKTKLVFEPVQHEGKAVRVRCEISFPIKQ